MPNKRLGGKKGKSGAKKQTISVRQAQDMLGTSTHHKEQDQQIIPTMDPKNSFFSKRLITADIDNSMLLTFRPLNIENHLIFEIQTSDPQMFLDVSSLMFSFQGQIKEQLGDGQKKALQKTPEVERGTANKRIWVHTVTQPPVGGGAYKLTMLEREVEVTKEYLMGLLVTPGPCFPISMWKSIGVSIGGAKLSNHCRDLLPFQIYLRTLLEMDPRVMTAQMRTGLFTLDEDDTLLPSDSNAGLTARFEAAGNSKKYNFQTPLIADGLTGWRQGQLLPGGVPLRISFEQGEARISMTAMDTRSGHPGYQDPDGRHFVVEYENPVIRARCYKLTAAAYKNFSDQLRQRELQIDFATIPMDYRFIHNNQTTFRFEIPNEPCLPDRFFCTLLDPDQFRGRYSKNSFWWTPHNISKIEVDFGDSSKKLEINADFTVDQYMEMYNFFLLENNVGFLDEIMPNITPHFYKNGRWGFMLDLSRNHSYGTSDIRTVPQTSKVELVLIFKQPLPEELVFLFASWREDSVFISSDLTARLND